MSHNKEQNKQAAVGKSTIDRVTQVRSIKEKTSPKKGIPPQPDTDHGSTVHKLNEIRKGRDI